MIRHNAVICLTVSGMSHLQGVFEGSVQGTRVAELMRAGLSRVGVNDSVMAYEHPHNLLETLLPEISPGAAQAGFRASVTQALPALKARNPEHYHRLQALALAAWRWLQAPVTRLEGVTAQLAKGATIRLVDMAVTRDGCLDVAPSADAQRRVIILSTGLFHLGGLRTRILMKTSGSLRCSRRLRSARLNVFFTPKRRRPCGPRTRSSCAGVTWFFGH